MTVGQKDGRKEGQKERWTERRTEGRTNERKDGQWDFDQLPCHSFIGNRLSSCMWSLYRSHLRMLVLYELHGSMLAGEVIHFKAVLLKEVVTGHLKVTGVLDSEHSLPQIQ